MRYVSDVVVNARGEVVSVKTQESVVNETAKN